jgi:hypothetical protein
LASVIAPGIDKHGHNGLLDSCWCRFPALLTGCTVSTREAPSKPATTTQTSAPLVDQLRQNGRRLRLLYQFGPSFKRITAGAFWADSRLGAHYLPLMDGCALVTSGHPSVAQTTKAYLGGTGGAMVSIAKLLVAT